MDIFDWLVIGGTALVALLAIKRAIFGHVISEDYCGGGKYRVVHSRRGTFYRSGGHPRTGVGGP